MGSSALKYVDIGSSVSFLGLQASERKVFTPIQITASQISN